jgi:hypothetical protein
VATGGITSTMIQNGAVTGADLADGAVSSPKLDLPIVLSGGGANSPFESLNSGSGPAVYAYATSGIAIYGTSESNFGVQGVSTGSGNIGRLGTPLYGVYGMGLGGDPGVYGYSASGYGVHGKSLSDYGVLGESTNDVGVYGSGSTHGVYGYSATGRGVMGHRNNGGDWAGYFLGNAHVTGTLSKGAGAFLIDHPLDPEHKVLWHSFVESPDMKNIYDGVVTTDVDGGAVVTLPDWFEALNRDFRYQLTVIGRFAQAIIEREIEGNRFTVRTNLANVKVSWQVTGIRKDAYAEAHRIPVEADKPAREQGTYLHPEAFGLSEERNVEWVRDPEGMRRMAQEAAGEPAGPPSLPAAFAGPK